MSTSTIWTLVNKTHVGMTLIGDSILDVSCIISMYSIKTSQYTNYTHEPTILSRLSRLYGLSLAHRHYVGSTSL